MGKHVFLWDFKKDRSFDNLLLIGDDETILDKRTGNNIGSSKHEEEGKCGNSGKGRYSHSTDQSFSEICESILSTVCRNDRRAATRSSNGKKVGTSLNKKRAKLCIRKRSWRLTTLEEQKRAKEKCTYSEVAEAPKDQRQTIKAPIIEMLRQENGQLNDQSRNIRNVSKTTRDHDQYKMRYNSSWKQAESVKTRSCLRRERS